jgi:hypothetical protein
LLGDNIKFKKIDEMKKIRLDPMLFDPVAKLAHRVYAQFTAELLAQQINENLAPGSKKPFRLHSDRQVVELSAKSCTVREEKPLILEDVTIVEIPLSAGGQRRTLRCQRCFLEIEGDELTPTLTLDVRNAKWQYEPGFENLIARYIIRGLVLPSAVTDQFKTADILQEIKPQAISAALRAGPSAYLTKLLNQLQRRITITLAQIGAETHSRLVFGVGCITIIMIGILLGIILKGGHLLTAFAASAIPALALITFIMMGKNITKNPLATSWVSGIALMWAGLIVLSVLALFLYRRLMKH